MFLKDLLNKLGVSEGMIWWSIAEEIWIIACIH